MKRTILAVTLLAFSSLSSAMTQTDINKFTAQQDLTTTIQKMWTVHGDGDPYGWVDQYNQITKTLDNAVSEHLKGGGTCKGITEKPVTKDMLDGNPIDDQLTRSFYKSIFHYALSQCKWLTSSDE